METIEEKVEYKVERVYYDLWGRDAFYRMIEKYRILGNRYKEAVSIEENNKFFLECYQDYYNKRGFKYCDMWLRGLLAGYVKRCSRENGDTPYKRQFYEDWINNNKWISGSFPELQKWCDDYVNSYTKSVNEETEDGGASTPPPSIAIIEEELKKYFQVAFYNKGNGSTDWFSRLIADLNIKRNDMDYARIAKMIYNGGWLQPRMKPSTFAEWYRIFCGLIGCEYHKAYKPNKLEEIESFNYLNRPKKG